MNLLILNLGCIFIQIIHLLDQLVFGNKLKITLGLKRRRRRSFSLIAFFNIHFYLTVLFLVIVLILLTVLILNMITHNFEKPLPCPHALCFPRIGDHFVNRVEVDFFVGVDFLNFMKLGIVNDQVNHLASYLRQLLHFLY